MKPSLETARAACPEVDSALINEHLSRLGDRYFETFAEPVIYRHLRALSRLSPPVYNCSLCTFG